MKFVRLTKPLVHPGSQLELFFEGDVLSAHAIAIWFSLTGCDYVTGDVFAGQPCLDIEVVHGDCVMRIVTTHTNTLSAYNLL